MSLQLAPPLGEVLRQVAAEHGTSIALTFGGRDTTYGDLYLQACRTANALRAAGLNEGSRIAIVSRNNDAFFILLFGAAMAGIVLVPVNWRLTASEMAWILEDAQVSMVFSDTASRGLAVEAAAAAALSPRTVDLEGTGADAFLPWIATASDRYPAADVSSHDVAVQLYTSGTTGRPKGAMLSHSGLMVVRVSQPPSVEWAAWTPDDVCLVSMPLFHIGGIGTALACIHYGARMIILREFDPDVVLHHVETAGVSKLFLVPTAIAILLRHPRVRSIDYGRLRYILYGSSPIAPALLQEAIEVFGCGFVQLYGMTETSGTVAALSPQDHLSGRPGILKAAGRPLHGVELAILSPAGDRLGTDQVGEIAVRCDGNMVGYWGRPEASADAFTDDGFLLTGDAGSVDEHGLLYVRDRIKDMIISGGENVYCAELEQLIAGHPAVMEVAVVGAPDPRWGEIVKAVIVTRAGESIDLDQLASWVRPHLASFKVPRALEIVDRLPRNAAGKVMRRELRTLVANEEE